MLETILKENNISLYALAKKTNIPYATLSDIKNKKVSPDNISVGILHRLSLALSVSMDQIYEELCKPDRLIIRTAADYTVSNRLTKKVENLRIPIPAFHTEGRFIYDKNKIPAWSLSFSYEGKDYSLLFNGVVSNERYSVLEPTGRFIIENFLKKENFHKMMVTEATE